MKPLTNVAIALAKQMTTSPFPESLNECKIIFDDSVRNRMILFVIRVVFGYRSPWDFITWARDAVNDT